MRRPLSVEAGEVLGRLPDGRELRADRVRFSAVTGGGPGGQNVNRRATKVELRVALVDLPLDADERARVRERLRGRITSGGDLVVTAVEERTQAANRRIAAERLLAMLADALAVDPDRVPTRVPRRARAARLDAKRRRSDRLAARRPPADG